MLKDITLGQYFPGKTPIHRLDPRTKLLLLVIYMVALFCAKWFVSYALVLVFLITATAVGRIPLRSMTRGLKPMLIFILQLLLLLHYYYYFLQHEQQQEDQQLKY